jgi:hypothetical protein
MAEADRPTRAGRSYAVLAAVLFGLSGCGAPEPKTGPSPTAFATIADETGPVCAQALSDSSAAVAALKGWLLGKSVALATEDHAKLAENQAGLLDAAATWSAKLVELAGRPIDAKVRTVLTEAIRTLDKVGSTTGAPAPGEAIKQLEDITTTLRQACP